MDLLLTHGYFLADDPLESHPYPPLGLLYLCAYLRRRGFDVEVFDTTFSTLEVLRQRISTHRPPVVGVAGNLMTRANVITIAKMAGELGSRVVLGGPEPGSYAEEYLEHGADVVVAGEGEETLAELLPVLLRGPSASDLGRIAGLAYRDEGRVVRTTARGLLPDLDALPFPERDAIDLEPYKASWRRSQGYSTVSLITARGCPYRCTWCSHSVYGVSHRRRSATNVADEVEHILERYRPDRLWYADDVFTIQPSWILDYAAELEKRDLFAPFEAITREDRLDEEMVRVLAHMGCFRLWIGAESGSQRVLDAMQRKTSAERMREMIHLVQSRGIEVGTFVMVGYDGETMHDLQETARHLKAARADIVLTTIAYPIKGTEYYERIAERIRQPGLWEASSDRDLVVEGRGSDRFYRYVLRWLVNELAWDRARRSTLRSRLVGLRAWLNARVGRVGMWWLQRRGESGCL